MKFSGRIQIEADPIQWLKTDLSMAQGRLELTSGNEILGSWSMTQVKAERIDGDRFELLLGEDRALFAADDALAFSYEALPHLSKKHILNGPTGLRGRLRHGLRGNEQHDTEPSKRGTSHVKTAEPARLTRSEPASVSGGPEASEHPMADHPVADHPVARRLRELIEAAGEERALQEASLLDPSEEIVLEPSEPAIDGLVPEEGDGRAEPVRLRAVAPPGGTESTEAEPVEAEIVGFEAGGSEAGGSESGEPESGHREFGDSELGDFAFEDVEVPLLAASELESIESEAAELANKLWVRANDRSPEPPDTIRTPRTGKLDLEPAFARATSPADDDPEGRIMIALEGVLAEVRTGSLSPAQVSAVTDLVQAVTDLVGARRS